MNTISRFYTYSLIMSDKKEYVCKNIIKSKLFVSSQIIEILIIFSNRKDIFNNLLSLIFKFYTCKIYYLSKYF